MILVRHSPGRQGLLRWCGSRDKTRLECKLLCNCMLINRDQSTRSIAGRVNNFRAMFRFINGYAIGLAVCAVNWTKVELSLLFVPSLISAGDGLSVRDPAYLIRLYRSRWSGIYQVPTMSGIEFQRDVQSFHGYQHQQGPCWSDCLWIVGLWQWLRMYRYGEVAPRTSENFRGLCTGEYNNSRTGKPMHYKGSRFTRIIPNFVVQAVRLVLGEKKSDV